MTALTYQEMAASIAAELSAHPERWTQGEHCRDRKGRYCRMEVACSWCLLAHIEKREPNPEANERIAELFRQHGGIPSLAYYNDHASRTVQDVIEFCARLAAGLER